MPSHAAPIAIGTEQMELTVSAGAAILRDDDALHWRGAIALAESALSREATGSKPGVLPAATSSAPMGDVNDLERAIAEGEVAAYAVAGPGAPCCVSPTPPGIWNESRDCCVGALRLVRTQVPSQRRRPQSTDRGAPRRRRAGALCLQRVG